MRWWIVRVIWFRELRDQLRDRRTIFMIAVLPILLYPLIGMGFLQLAAAYWVRQSDIGVSGSHYLPPPPQLPAAALALPWLLGPVGPGAPLAGLPQCLGAAGTAEVVRSHLDFPPLLVFRDGQTRIAPRYLDSIAEEDSFRIHLLPQRPSQAADPLEGLDRSDLENKRVQVLLVVPPSFCQEVQQGGQPVLYLLGREGDEQSRLVQARLATILNRWKADLKTIRLLQKGLPPNYDDAFTVWDPDQARNGAARGTDDLFKVLTQIFPFVLVMWSLAGALYPAVDLCAGEKERGTMETLLISPASREEIVWGKFLTIWVFSAATALLNLLSMGLTTWQFSQRLPASPFQLGTLFWGVLLLLPLSAFFSAMCLSVGVYARSTKEGQYYLMPLFLMTMPLIFLTLAPGVELNAFYSMVPVTGVALLIQSLMAAGTLHPSQQHLFYFLPVLAPMILYSWLALRWAIEQFQREEVLFREAERLDLRLWLRHLFRDKEPLPSVGQVLFCFLLILALRWISFNIGEHRQMLVRTGISQLAFMVAPPLFMVLLLTTRPQLGLGLTMPPWWAWPVAGLLGFLVVPPMSELLFWILNQFPGLKLLLEQYHPLTTELQALVGEEISLAARLRYLLVLGVLPALCEELTFRGFILCGLVRRFRPWTAILLSSFLFAVYQMNVFQFLPHFVVGCILGLLVLRTGSVLTGMLFHLIYNILLFIPVIFHEPFGSLLGSSELTGGLEWFRIGLAVLCTLLTLGILGALLLIGRREKGSGWRIPLQDRSLAAALQSSSS